MGDNGEDFVAEEEEEVTEALVVVVEDDDAVTVVSVELVLTLVSKESLLSLFVVERVEEVEEKVEMAADNLCAVLLLPFDCSGCESLNF